MKSNWSVLKHYINSKEIGDVITRKNIKNEVQDYLTISSFDRYCKWLVTIFILEKLDEPGHYKILYKIPDNLNTPSLFRLTNIENWKHWFIPIEDRMKMLN